MAGSTARSSEVLHATKTARVEYFFAEGAAHRSIALVFSPSKNRNLDGNPYGGEVLLRNGYDVVSFKSAEDDWFQHLPLGLFESVDRICAQPRYVRRVAYGSSMGGYAAIAFSRRFRLDRVLALSPQFTIREAFDTRWAPHARRIDWRYAITQETVASGCEFYVVYDQHDADRLHVDRLAQVIAPERMHRVVLSYCGHPAAHYLAELGLIKDLLLSVLGGGEPRPQDLRSGKADSISYLTTLSLRLFRRRKLRLALALIDRALLLGPGRGEVLRHRAIVLDGLGRLEEAIDAMRAALAKHDNNALLHDQLARLLAKAGRPGDALAASNRAVELAPRAAALLRRNSALCLAQHESEAALRAIERAIAREPRDPESHRLRAQVLASLQRSEEAIAAMTHAVALRPSDAGLHHGLSVLLAGAQRLEAALEAGRRAVAGQGASARMLVHCANLLAHAGAYEEALALTKRAQAGGGGNAVALERLRCSLQEKLQLSSQAAADP